MTDWLAQETLHRGAPHPPDIPRRFAAYKPADLPQGPLRDTAYGYLQAFWTDAAVGRAPVFLGAVRTGKTITACAIANTLYAGGSGTIRRPIDVVFVNAAEHLPSLNRERYRKATAARVARWKQATFLVVDEFGVAKDDAEISLLLEIMTYRWNEQRPTLWTANFERLNDANPFEPIARRFGPVFARRLEDAGKGYTVILD